MPVLVTRTVRRPPEEGAGAGRGAPSCGGEGANVCAKKGNRRRPRGPEGEDRDSTPDARG